MATKKDMILNNMDQIKQWVSEGMTMKSIADALHVSKSTLYKYIEVEGLDVIKNSRAAAVERLENTMFRSATGHTKKVKKYMKVKKCEYRDGKKHMEWEDVLEYEEEIFFPPDTTAGIFLLKNWGRYMNEPATVDVRKKELELKEKQVNTQLWLEE